MKTIFASLLLVLCFSATVSAQCSVPVVTGCVGACGATFSYTYTVTPADVFPTGVAVFCLAATSNTLCPSDRAVASLSRNFGPAIFGNLDQGDVLKRKAVAGDILTITVRDIVVDPSISCFWLGETHFALSR